MKTNFVRLTVQAALLVAGVFLLGVCLVLGQAENPSGPQRHKWDYTALEKAPAKARAKRNPLEGGADAIAAGEKLYARYCAECHGKDARGGKRGPSLRDAAVRKATPGAMFFVLTNGVIRRGMPDWSSLPEPERWQVVSFLESLQK